MAENPFTKKSYVDVVKEKPKMSSMDSVDEEPKVSKAPENIFVQKSKGFSKENSRVPEFEPARVGTEEKVGLYAELAPEGKLKIQRADESSRFTGETYSGAKTPDFRSSMKDEPVSFRSSVVRNVEQGEPYAVYTDVTGRSLRTPRVIQTEARSISEKREASAIRAQRNIEATRELQRRKDEAIARAKKFQSPWLGGDAQIKALEDKPLIYFGDLSFGRARADLSKEGRELLEKNPSLTLELGNVEKESYYASKEKFYTKEMSGKILSNVAEYSEVTQVAVDIFGNRIGRGRLPGTTGEKRQQIQETLARKEFKELGYTEKESAFLAKKTIGGSRIRQGTVGALQLSPEVATEITGAKVLTQVLSKIDTIPLIPAARQAGFKAGVVYAGLGAFEGSSTVFITEKAQGEVKGRDVLFGAGLGAFTAPVFGALPIALEVKGGGKSLPARGLRFVGNVADFPSEQLGDVSAKPFIKTRPAARYALDGGRVKTVTFVPSTAVVPSSVSSSVPTLSRSENVFLNVPSKSVISEASVTSPANSPVFTNTPSPVSIFTNTPVPVETNVPTATVIQSTIPTVVSASGLPIVPPPFGIGGGSVGLSKRGGRRYINELDIGLSLLGSKRVVKRSKSKKDKRSKFRTINLGFGGLGAINMGRV